MTEPSNLVFDDRENSELIPTEETKKKEETCCNNIDWGFCCETTWTVIGVILCCSIIPGIIAVIVWLSNRDREERIEEYQNYN